MPCLVQIYAPLPDSAFHRVLYIFACNLNSCWKQQGKHTNASKAYVDYPVCVIRGQVLDKVYADTMKQKEEKEKENKASVSGLFGAIPVSATSSSLGSLWLNKNTSSTAATFLFPTTKQQSIQENASHQNKTIEHDESEAEMLSHVCCFCNPKPGMV